MKQRGVVRLSAWNAGVSGVLALSLGAAFFLAGSELAFAQAADSLVDCVGGLLLTYAAQVGSTPRDDNHPFGHTRAEPLGALAIAALALWLAFEVAASAVRALWWGERAQVSSALLGLFLAKVLVKAVIFAQARRQAGAASEALRVDARNDIMVGLLAVGGSLLSLSSSPLWDAGVALPVALYVGYSGFELARDNVSHLMGTAPSAELQERWVQLVESVPGVSRVSDFKAQHLGREISVHLTLPIAGTESVSAAAQLEARVREVLEREPEIVHCCIHWAPHPVPHSAESGA